ncbi:D-tagatose-bisphosphate aldolase, class II, non-catalytic subunit [Neorhizobium alkalisoli]|uniref:Tagatose-bisphosphate aldolase noncatalytic subunit n=1 Tax=Neorhizobium alkalisoli TaxID=528178 RepID=A0A561QG64_9HYPH|nr:D-tagatose-bisphosphate aldolase, class II, non-catalytic subunit [Neorhizobium alkalisoli]TWF49344.1 tagatose-bisphosphate aldolase noncatalytic subunit [Neorhizobium alkalisoli]
MTSILLDLAKARRAGKTYGITSVCSAHPTVLRAALRRAAATGRPVLIEATCNQVNQFGGYTGMTPEDFVSFVGEIAGEEGVSRDNIIFGGDHLGPNPWKKEPADTALAKAEAMVEAYVRAGFTKIHLDASMGCAGEPVALADDVVAHRAARLALAAERVSKEIAGAPLVYILGTEVPVPGGADHVLDHVEPTAPAAARSTIEVHRKVFAEAGLDEAFSRVIAFVVQPGVEFGSENVVAYEPELSQSLTALLDEEPQFVFEAHSTDYQSLVALASLVEEGFPILKVGPGLTFAYREAIYGLDMIASEMVAGYGNRPLMQCLEKVMLAEPADWQGHYHGDEASLRLQRHYSYSDRIRYYWARPDVTAAVARLFEALRNVSIPETLLHQYVPLVLPAATLPLSAEEIVIAAVDVVLADYDAAVMPSGV